MFRRFFNLPRRHSAPVLVLLSMGMLVSAFCLFSLRAMEKTQARNSFRLVARQRTENFNADLDTVVDRVNALSAFCRTGGALNRSSFDSFASALLPGPHAALRSLEWVPVVPLAQRKEFERTARADGLHGYEIRDRLGKGAPARAGERAFYFPILYVQPAGTGGLPIGSDGAADGVRGEVFRRALESGNLALSAPFRVHPDSSSPYLLLIVRPVHARRGGSLISHQLLGFAVGVLQIGNLVKEPDASSGVRLSLTDISTALGGEQLYPAAASAARSSAKFSESSLLSVGGRRWRLVVAPDPAAFPVRHMYSYAGGALALLLTFLLATQVSEAMDRHWQVECEVEERSRELTSALGSLAEAHRGLEESQARYRRLVDDCPAAIVVEREGKIVLANRVALELFAVRPDHVLERLSLLDFVAPESVLLAKRFLSLVETGLTRVGPHEIRLLRRDGTSFDAEFSASTFVQNNVRCIQLLAQDVSQRKHDEALKARLISAIDQVCESIVITDTGGNIIYVNPAFERVTGYSFAEALGKNPSVLSSDRHPREFYQHLWETLRSGHAWRGHFVNRAKDGHLFTEEAAISPVFDRGGQIVNYVAVKRDVTREMELQEQLHQSRKMDAIGRLAGGVAHDFNNMLMVILSYAELLAASLAPDDPLRAHTEQILTAAQRSSALTRQLLTFSRKQVIAPQLMDCNAVVHETSNMVRRLISEEIELRCTLARDLWSIKADPAQIMQVILNLCVNSRDAMPGGGTITIATRNVVQEEDFVEISVSDSGIGIPAEVQERLFEPFFTTKERGKGTGLGLATVYGIVQQAGGEIRFESTPGVGTTFYICLPRCRESAVQDEAPEAEQPRAVRLRVLVVEDEDALREAIVDQLRNRGYEVISAADGESALELLPRYPDVAVLVCDLVMPRMGGRELARQAAERIPDLRVVYMSGHADQLSGESDGDAAQAVFLQKPFPVSALLACIAERGGCPPIVAARQPSRMSESAS